MGATSVPSSSPFTAGAVASALLSSAAAITPATPPNARALPPTATRSVADREAGSVTLWDFKPEGTGLASTVLEWASNGLYPRYPYTKSQTASLLAAIQAEYPRVRALTQTIDWAACQHYGDWIRAHGKQSIDARTNGSPIYRIPPGLWLDMGADELFLGCDRSGTVGHYVDGTAGTVPGDAGYKGDPLAFIMAVEGNGSVIYSRAAGRPAVSWAGGRFCRVDKLTVVGDQTAPPQCGFYTGRGGYIGADPTTGVSSDQIKFTGCQGQGYFTVSVWYNFASEDEKKLYCYGRVVGGGAKAVSIISQDNAEGIGEAYQTKQPSGFQATNVKSAELFCEWYYDVPNSEAVTAAGATKIISGTAFHTSWGNFLSQLNGPIVGVPHMLVTGTDSSHPSSHVHVNGDHHHGSYSDGIVFAQSCASGSIRGLHENSPGRTGATLNILNNFQLADFEWISAEAVAAAGVSGGIFRVGTLHIKGTGGSCAIAGTLSGHLVCSVTETVGLKGYFKVAGGTGVGAPNNLSSWNPGSVAMTAVSNVFTPALSTVNKNYTGNVAANSTIANPTSPTLGQVFHVTLKPTAGTETITWGSGYKFVNHTSPAPGAGNAGLSCTWTFIADVASTYTCISVSGYH